MKAVCAILLLASVASAQFGGGNRFFNNRQNFGNNGGFGGGGGASVDGLFNGWEYNYSWLHTNGAKWVHNGAVNYCRSLPGNWLPVSINDEQENRFIQNVIGRGGVEYIWTSGTGIPGNPNSFRWANGRFIPFGWSRTGGFRRPQPDNREGNEACLSVLNNIYPNDGITWHDVGCHHRKPTICERPARNF